MMYRMVLVEDNKEVAGERFPWEKYGMRLVQEFFDIFSSDLGKLEVLDGFGKIVAAENANDFLLEVSVLYARMETLHYSEKERESVGRWLIKALEGEKTTEEEGIPITGTITRREVCRQGLAILYHKDKAGREQRKEERMEELLLEIYCHIEERNLSLQWLAKEVFYMNEEYLGRLFSRNMHRKFSEFVSETRVKIAKQLLWYYPGLSISNLAQSVGYSADGQYFSRIFKKYVGMKPSDYREYVIYSKDKQLISTCMK